MSNTSSTFRTLAVAFSDYVSATERCENALVAAVLATRDAVDAKAGIASVVADAKAIVKTDPLASQILPSHLDRAYAFLAIAEIADLDADGTYLIVERVRIESAVKALGWKVAKGILLDAHSNALTRGEAIERLITASSERKAASDKDIAALLKAASGPVGKAETLHKGGAALKPADVAQAKALIQALSTLVG